MVSRGHNRAAQALLARRQILENDEGDSDSDIFGSEGDRPAIANELSESERELSAISDGEKQIAMNDQPSSPSESGEESAEAEEVELARPVFLKKEDRDLLHQSE